MLNIVQTVRKTTTKDYLRRVFFSAKPALGVHRQTLKQLSTNLEAY